MMLTVQYAAAQSESYFLHTVTKGQGLYSISRMYGVTEADIIALNPGSDVVIKVGEQLRIPQKTQQTTQESTSQGTQQATGEGGQRFHTIKTGETLYRLTVIYGLTAREICDANPGLSAENFKVGQVIVIPKKQETTAEPVQKVTEPAPLVGKQQTETVVEKPTKQEKPKSQCKTEHKVKRKENIYRLSRMYGITELELINANPELKERKLKRGETICIPYSKEELQQMASQQEPIKQPEESTPTTPVDPTNEDLFAESKDKAQNIEQIKAALILPFMLDGGMATDEQQKMVEFYEGFLLAMDSLKKDGVSN